MIEITKQLKIVNTTLLVMIIITGFLFGFGKLDVLYSMCSIIVCLFFILQNNVMIGNIKITREVQILKDEIFLLNVKDKKRK